MRVVREPEPGDFHRLRSLRQTAASAHYTCLSAGGDATHAANHVPEMPEAISGGQQILWLLRNTVAGSAGGGAQGPATTRGIGSACGVPCSIEGYTPCGQAGPPAAIPGTKYPGSREARFTSKSPRTRSPHCLASCCPGRSQAYAAQTRRRYAPSFAGRHSCLYGPPHEPHRSNDLGKEGGRVAGEVPYHH